MGDLSISGTRNPDPWLPQIELPEPPRMVTPTVPLQSTRPRPPCPTTYLRRKGQSWLAARQRAVALRGQTPNSPVVPSGREQVAALSACCCLASEDAAGVSDPLIHLPSVLSALTECGDTMAWAALGAPWGEAAQAASPQPRASDPIAPPSPRGHELGDRTQRWESRRQFKSSKPKGFHS